MNGSALTQGQLEALLREFKRSRAEAFRLQTLGYFGSFARDEGGPDSDVDVVFETDAPNLFRTAQMREELAKLLGREVDVVRLRKSMNPRLRARIERDAVYV